MPTSTIFRVVHRPRSQATAWLLLGAVVWLGLIAGGMALMMAYENTAGRAAPAPAMWPRTSRLTRVPGRPTLVLAAHPRCPCTRATIGQLAAVLGTTVRPTTVHVLFFKPAGTSDEWARTELWTSAAALPGVTISTDEDGREAALFGGETSGDAQLFDAAGRLVFRGGLTAGRGQTGASAGRTALAALLAGEMTALRQTPVFGCSLSDCPSPTPFSRTP